MTRVGQASLAIMITAVLAVVTTGTAFARPSGRATTPWHWTGRSFTPGRTIVR